MEILNNGFSVMTDEQMLDVDGGSWKKGACVFLGTVGLAWSVPVGCLNLGAGLSLAGVSLATLDAGI